jgi:hypothetical protein
MWNIKDASKRRPGQMIQQPCHVTNETRRLPQHIVLIVLIQFRDIYMTAVVKDTPPSDEQSKRGRDTSRNPAAPYSATFED